ncbi:hypothetical protein [Paenibacillus sp. An7]|uniref:hypothetical protein n=1 Tax=Paenibacillus sp. An7 TaxID=2689577 RepID=UPI001356C049|nr:hypothetical protein [Paenibacillus sp. An7]
MSTPVFLLIFYVAICLLINEMIKFHDLKQGEKPNPRGLRIGLVPLLALLPFVPIVLFTFFYTLFFYSFSEFTNIFSASSHQSLFNFSLAMLIGFFICEEVLKPMIITLFNMGLRLHISEYTKHVITIGINSIFIYLISSYSHGIYIHSFTSAISIAVFYSMIDWILMLIIHLYNKLKAKL